MKWCCYSLLFPLKRSLGANQKEKEKNSVTSLPKCIAGDINDRKSHIR